ncbi:Arc family DNA-binding protein [Maritimibacter fusiformis]|uniref:Arc family DNA-binding protein n=1 Tax=Maritimibacter fusiformis TaxID=2603819 RepID=A0A5D0RKR2_9RHOB|nr:Arc family DNA-binding protein [Maritimibacter fusiformis]TYB81759.1 Arc family DNA-binding protein [Maritimibacter fusiformis]
MKSEKAELGQIVIRPPEGMRERIKHSAAAHGRSMNAEIVAALENHFRQMERRQAGWRWVPPEEQIPDAYRAAIRDQAERRGTSYGEELTAALVGYYIDPDFARDKVSRERLMRLVSEIVDIVEYDAERRRKAEADDGDG